MENTKRVCRVRDRWAQLALSICAALLLASCADTSWSWQDVSDMVDAANGVIGAAAPSNQVIPSIPGATTKAVRGASETVTPNVVSLGKPFVAPAVSVGGQPE
jgi:hypothetical protein